MAMELFDTHCHVHELETHLTPVYDKWRQDGVERTDEIVLARAREAGVTRLLVIGTSLADSEAAIAYAEAHEGVWASIGIHPHEAHEHTDLDIQHQFAELADHPKVVAVGECGLDYFYTHSPKAEQTELLRFQLQLAHDHDLPLSFHVREAFDDFWPILEECPGLQGVLHSFTDSSVHMQRAVDLGLYIGVNGISTFTKDAAQLAMYQSIPLERLLLETDAPFLTPKPFRGKVCEPMHSRVTAEFLSGLRGANLETIATITTENARKLFRV
jgi:TatD DNase family protein